MDWRLLWDDLCAILQAIILLFLTVIPAISLGLIAAVYYLASALVEMTFNRYTRRTT